MKMLCTNCLCDVSTLAESWKIMHCCAYMPSLATHSFRQGRSCQPQAAAVMAGRIELLCIPRPRDADYLKALSLIADHA